MAEGLFAIDILKCNLTVKKKKLNQNTTLEFYQSIVIKVRYVFHLIQLGLKKNYFFSYHLSDSGIYPNLSLSCSFLKSD